MKKAEPYQSVLIKTLLIPKKSTSPVHKPWTMILNSYIHLGLNS